MHRIFKLIAIILCSVALAQSQSLFIGLGAGYSYLDSRDTYVATVYDEPRPWQRVVKVVRGGSSDDGFDLSGQFSLAFPNSPWRISALLSYALLHGKSDSATATVPPISSLAFQSGAMKTRYSLVSVGAGVQWQAVRSAISPYLSLRFFMNHLGETQVNLPKQPYTSEFSFDGRTRFGLSLGAGMTCDLLQSFPLDLQVDYLSNNLVGREDGESVQHGIVVRLSLLYQLF
jgi:hypothetical protein